MIIPKEHVEQFHELDKEQLDQLNKIIAYISRVFQKDEKYGGYNLLNNNGTLAGQHINHCHIHLFVRFNNEKISPFDVLAGKYPKKLINTDEWQNNYDAIKAALI